MSDWLETLLEDNDVVDWGFEWDTIEYLKPEDPTQFFAKRGEKATLRFEVRAKGVAEALAKVERVCHKLREYSESLTEKEEGV